MMQFSCYSMPRPMRRPAGAVLTLALGICLAAGCSRNPTPAGQGAVAAGSGEGTAVQSAPSPLNLPKGTISADNLLAYAREASKPLPKDDQFVKRFNDKPLLGRTFKVTVPYSEYNSSLHYQYNAEREKLHIWTSLNSSYHDEVELDPKVDYVILQQDSVYGQPRPMSNAFGLTKDVTPVAYTTVGLGSLRDTYVGVFPKGNYSQRDYIFYRNLDKEIAISPEEGRKAVRGLAMDLEGEVVGKYENHPILCKHTVTKAKIDYAYEQTWDECIILIRFTRIAIHSPKLGLIAEWKAPSGNSGRKARGPKNGQAAGASKSPAQDVNER